MGILVVVRADLKLLLSFQRRSVRIQELAALSADTGIPLSDVTKNLLNTVLLWGERMKREKGFDPSDPTPEYREFVARQISLFDLVLLDPKERSNPETVSRIKQELALHKAALSDWALALFRHVPVSKDMAALIQAARS